MNPRIALARMIPRTLIRGLVLDRLFTLTADAFERPLPDLKGADGEEKLRLFAFFTREAAGQALKNKADAEVIRARLYEKARDLGTEMRNRLKPGSTTDEAALCSLLYGWLGIKAEAGGDGRLVIRECYFSRFYSPPVCELISALDQGAAAGLTGGGRLSFQARITEGEPCCRARLEPGGGRS